MHEEVNISECIILLALAQILIYEQIPWATAPGEAKTLLSTFMEAGTCWVASHCPLPWHTHCLFIKTRSLKRIWGYDSDNIGCNRIDPKACKADLDTVGVNMQMLIINLRFLNFSNLCFRWKKAVWPVLSIHRQKMSLDLWKFKEKLEATWFSANSRYLWTWFSGPWGTVAHKGNLWRILTKDFEAK